MGVLPLEFTAGETRKSLGLTGRESYSIEGLAAGVARRQKLKVRVTDGGSAREFEVLARIDTPEEVEYMRHGGILPYVLRELLHA
jgi:aconitate hydratase